MIKIFHNNKLIANFQKDKKYVLEYKDFELKNSISLSLPNTQKFYISDEMIAYFDTFLPEGYLFEIFKNYLIKEFGYIDDYLLFSVLSPNIEGRIRYISEFESENQTFDFTLKNILENDNEDTFQMLLKIFLNKNAISGVQPKSMAVLKESLTFKKYIVKTWGKEFLNLAENEYISLKTIEFSGVNIPNIHLSKNKNFLVVERFDENLGFEEAISLFNKTKLLKYSGSYEQIAKEFYKYLSDLNDLKTYFKLIVMNYLLKNGDAHLKNFGLLFNDDFSNITIAPAYDVVTTVVYIFNDKPALTLNGQKLWHSKDKLIDFGIKYCYLSKKEAENLFEECYEALKKGIVFLEDYINKNPSFEKIGLRMLDVWKHSLKLKEEKEIPFEFRRAWKQN